MKTFKKKIESINEVLSFIIKGQQIVVVVVFIALNINTFLFYKRINCVNGLSFDSNN
jgi:hypothetical protein